MPDAPTTGPRPTAATLVPAGVDGVLLMALAPERISESLRAREVIRADADATGIARAVLNRVADTVDSSTRFRIDLVLTDLICQRTLDVATAQERDFELEVSRAPGRVRVELVDEGSPLPPARGSDPAPPGGELALVAELADRWGMSFDVATTIWFEFEAGTAS